MGVCALACVFVESCMRRWQCNNSAPTFRFTSNLFIIIRCAPSQLHGGRSNNGLLPITAWVVGLLRRWRCFSSQHFVSPLEKSACTELQPYLFRHDSERSKIHNKICRISVITIVKNLHLQCCVWFACFWHLNKIFKYYFAD